MVKKIASNDRDLLIELIRTNFKLRYNNSALGFTWVLLKPFLTFAVLYAVFGLRENQQIQHFSIYLLSGIILFTFVNEGVIFGLNALLDKANIILKVNFNRTIAVISSEVMAWVNLSINLIILLIFIAFNPIDVNPTSFAYLILNLATVAIGLMGISFFSSIIMIKLRDIQNIVELIMQLLFYGSAIFYPIEQIPQKFRFIFELNPMYILINASREALIYGKIVMEDKVFILFFISLLLFVLGRFYFMKKVKKVAEYF